MLNFTVGPVMSPVEVRTIGAIQVPYFRTEAFSALMLENETYMLACAKAPSGSRALFLTCSGTGSMEAVVMNCFTKADKVLVIDGGSFGHRFANLCAIHEIPHTVLELSPGQKLTKQRLYRYDNQGFTSLLVNVDETSTGVLYDTTMLGEFCRQNHLFFVCDCISSFLADPFDMAVCGADVMITGSQKALACPPGISVLVLAAAALERIAVSRAKTMYFDLRDALKNQARGQTPFTPAVGILLQLNARLKTIVRSGGADTEVARVAALAADFRKKIQHLPLELVSQNPANGVTALHPLHADAHEIVLKLQEEYGIWICPNGGDLASSVFRVGHLGALTPGDNDTLVNALTDLHHRGIL